MVRWWGFGTSIAIAIDQTFFLDCTVCIQIGWTPATVENSPKSRNYRKKLHENQIRTNTCICFPLSEFLYEDNYIDKITDNLIERIKQGWENDVLNT